MRSEGLCKCEIAADTPRCRRDCFPSAAAAIQRRMSALKELRRGRGGAAAGSGPEDSSPVSFMNEKRKEKKRKTHATMKIVLLIPLCLPSPLPLLAAASNSILPLRRERLLLSPRIVMHCLALKNEDNARWNNAQASRRRLFLSGVCLLSCLGCEKIKIKK